MHRLGGLFALPKALREETSLSANLSSSAAPTQPSRWGPFGYVAFTVIWTASVVSNVGGPPCSTPRPVGWRANRNQTLFPSSFSSLTAAWYLRRISARSTEGAGKARPRSAIVSAMICDTARLRNHLWFDGITYHGASRVLVARIASSNASM